MLNLFFSLYLKFHDIPDSYKFLHSEVRTIQHDTFPRCQERMVTKLADRTLFSSFTAGEETLDCRTELCLELNYDCIPERNDLG